MAEYIDREALFAEFDRLGLGEHSIVEKVFSIGVRTIIAGMPAADVAPVVHGRWIMRGGKFRCSVCDAKANWVECGGSCFSHEYEQVKSPWCHSCGAKMDGGAE